MSEAKRQTAQKLKKYLETMPVTHAYGWAIVLFLVWLGMSQVWELLTR